MSFYTFILIVAAYFIFGKYIREFLKPLKKLIKRVFNYCDELTLIMERNGKKWGEQNRIQYEEEMAKLRKRAEELRASDKTIKKISIEAEACMKEADEYLEEILQRAKTAKTADETLTIDFKDETKTDDKSEISDDNLNFTTDEKPKKKPE